MRYHCATPAYTSIIPTAASLVKCGAIGDDRSRGHLTKQAYCVTMSFAKLNLWNSYPEGVRDPAQRPPGNQAELFYGTAPAPVPNPAEVRANMPLEDERLS